MTNQFQLKKTIKSNSPRIIYSHLLRTIFSLVKALFPYGLKGEKLLFIITLPKLQMEVCYSKPRHSELFDKLNIS